MARPTNRRHRAAGTDQSGPDWHDPSERWLGRPIQRIGARFIDGIILVLPALLVTEWFDAVPQVAILSVLLGFSLVVEPLLVAFVGGSFGKLAAGLRIVRRFDGQGPPGLWVAFKRQVAPSVALTLALVVASLTTAGDEILDGLDNAANLVVGVLSLWWILNDPERRSVLDRFGGTVVVRVREAGPPGGRTSVIPRWVRR